MQAKRKLTALLLSLCMVLSVLPTAVFAADDPLVGGSQETDPYEPQMIDKIELEVDGRFQYSESGKRPVYRK